MPIQARQYQIRLLKRTEIEQLLLLCKAEGRHMGTVAEVDTWMQIDPDGFYVATNENDQIIGSCCGMCLSDRHGYVGMYVVAKEYRGLGIGTQVWNAAIDHLGGRNLGLSAVAHLFTLYRDKAGFGQVADWTVDLYKLDYMEALFFHCNKHQVNTKRRRFENRKNFRPVSDVMPPPLPPPPPPSVADPYRKQCVFCCLAHQYKSKERKFLKHKKLTKDSNNQQKQQQQTVELSDDESYGFSKLFNFAEDHETESGGGAGAGGETKENPEEEAAAATANAARKIKCSELFQFESLEFLSFKLRFCKCIQCHGGKMRTIIVNPNNRRSLVERVVDYDRQLHPYDRSRIVRYTMAEKNCISRVAMLGPVVVGYGCVKPSLQNMWIMSPLYADNEYVARMLMIDLVSDLILINQTHLDQAMVPSVMLKAPSNNHRAGTVLAELGFVKQDYSLKRCYTKLVEPVPTQFIYALHTSVFCTE